MNKSAIPTAESPLPRLSDETVVEIQRFLEYLFDLFEAHYGDQITRFYDSMSRDSLLGADADAQSDEPLF